jgi:hypothetical protein
MREAIFQCRRELKEIREPNTDGKDIKAFSFDEDVKLWYTYSQSAMDKANAIIAKKMNDPAFHQMLKEKWRYLTAELEDLADPSKKTGVQTIIDASPKRDKTVSVVAEAPVQEKPAGLTWDGGGMGDD